MKLNDSAFLKEKRPVLEELLQELLKRYPFASVMAQDATEKRCTVSRRLTGVSAGGVFSARGFVVKAFDGQHWSEHSFNQLTKEDLPRVLDEICRAAAMSEAVMPEGVAERVYGAPEAEKLTFHGSTEYELDPDEVGVETVV